MLLIGLEFRVGTTESVALINIATSILAIVTIAVCSQWPPVFLRGHRGSGRTWATASLSPRNC